MAPTSRFFKALAAASAFALLPALAHAASITSTFDTDDEGWTLSGGTLSFQPMGGNPGGFIQGVDGNGGLMTLTAGSAYDGAALQDGGTLSFDFIELVNPNSNFNSAGIVTLSGGGDSASLDLIDGDPGNTWETYSANLTAGVWGKTQTDWENLIANISSITVNVESGTQITETIGFDNFSVSVVPDDTGVPAVPLPASLPILAGGLAALGLMGRRRRS